MREKEGKTSEKSKKKVERTNEKSMGVCALAHLPRRERIL